ncbi:MAG: hypothetical protein ACOX4Q_06650 [Syntrophomonadales bacterium]
MEQQYKGRRFEDLLRETRRVWDLIPGDALEQFAAAIQNSDKYTQREKEIAAKILLDSNPREKEGHEDEVQG